MKKKPDYLRLLCSGSNSDKNAMERAIKASGYKIKPNFPLAHSNSKGHVVMWFYELDIIYDKNDPIQRDLLKLQDNSLGL